MGMGIVSTDDFDAELNKLNPQRERETSKPEVTIIDIHKGRGEGNIEVPDALRKVIGEESQLNGRSSALEFARHFGVSPSSVSAYNAGSHSTSSYDETPNRAHLNNARERVVKRARSKMMAAMSNITPEKLANEKARDLAAIAKDMAVVIKTMEPDDEGKKDGVNMPQFLIYAPQIKDERTYETIYVKE